MASHGKGEHALTPCSLPLNMEIGLGTSGPPSDKAMATNFKTYPMSIDS